MSKRKVKRKNIKANTTRRGRKDKSPPKDKNHKNNLTSKVTSFVKVKRPTEKEKDKTAEKELSTARKGIQDTIITEKPPTKGLIDISKYYSVSTNYLKDYVTLDWQHHYNIKHIINNIAEYAKDKKRKRPLNIMLQAKPGSGKSHFIKCLTKKMSPYDLKEVVFNMTSMEHLHDLVNPLESVRNLKVNDKLPLLFLDEFDCDERNIPVLLPLMWDGELQVGNSNLEVGKVVIVLAGSKKNIIASIESSKGMHNHISTGENKLIDLLSRINGGTLTIPGLDEYDSRRDRNRKVDKICISISLLLNRFENIEIVPWALLNFISHTAFLYGVRSISSMIDLIPLKKKKTLELKINDMKLPFDKPKSLVDSPLVRHIVSPLGAGDVVDFWKQIKKYNNPVRIVKEKIPLSPLDSWFEVFPVSRTVTA